MSTNTEKKKNTLSHEVDYQLDIEWEFLEGVCRNIWESHEQSKMLYTYVRHSEFNWGNLLEHAIRHKMLPRVALWVREHKLLQELPLRIQDCLNDALNVSYYKTELFRREAAIISKALMDKNITFCGRKGIIFEGLLYDGNGARNFVDLDFLMDGTQGDVVLEVMSDLGYKIGDYDHYEDKVIPLPRQDEITYRLNPDHLPRLNKCTNELIGRFIEVDFSTSLSWTNSGFDIPLDTIFSSICLTTIGISNNKIPRMAIEFHFLDTVMHLYREAYLEKTIQSGNDVSLTGFLDIAVLWKKFSNKIKSKNFQNFIKDYNLQRPIGWVLYHVDSVFQTNMLGEMKLENHLDAEYLNSWRASGGKINYWQGNMKQRLRHKNRHKQLFYEK